MREVELFAEALEKPDAERASYLAEACADDVALRDRVQVLLKAHNDAGSLLDVPQSGVAVTVDQPTVAEKPGTQIGSYKLLQHIGEGGFGVVYMAEQHKPVRRKVALKIIKPGMDTKEVIARFEAERQALALMDHPNIATVLDGGATESGRPYFVMELVRGVPITEFCDEQRLSTRERLQLFVEICRAIQHAHQKGIIHRDLKPTNVMVTLDDNRPIPKVIDFGISKALSQQLTEKTLFTAYGQMVGTPLYMAPEQAQMSMRDVDTRSDVYSLGVVLYELLTGTTPFDKASLQKSSFDEMRRIICEVEPPRPSARISTLKAEALSTVSDKRRIDSRKLSQSLRGELDWIVMKALEKDRTRRYESASAFAEDVERYLDDEPVLACPPSLGYRLGKAVRRHRNAVASAAMILAALIAFGGYYFYSAGALSAANTELGTTNDRLQFEKENVRLESAAKDDAIKKLQQERRRARIKLSTFLLTRGQESCNDGRVPLGLLWMVRALEAAPQDAADLQRAIRINLANWQRQTSQLRLVVKLPVESKSSLARFNSRFLPSGKTIRTITHLDSYDKPGEKSRAQTSLWNAETGKPVGKPFTFPHWPRSRPPGGDTVVISHDDSTMVSRSEPKTVRIWDLQTRRPVGKPLVHPHEIGWISLNDNGRILLTTTMKIPGRLPIGGTSYLWDATTGKPIGNPVVHPEKYIRKARLSPDGSHLVTFAARKVQLWKTVTAEPHGTPLEAPPVESGVVVGRIIEAVFTPDSRFLFVLYEAGANAPNTRGRYARVRRVVRVWDVKKRQPVGNRDFHLVFKSSVSNIVFSPDGVHFVVYQDQAADTPFEILQWVDREQPSSQFVRHKKLNHDRMTGAAFSPDGRLLTTFGRDNQIRVWDVATGEEIGSPLLLNPTVVKRPFSYRHRSRAFVLTDRRSVQTWHVPQGVSPPVWSASLVFGSSARGISREFYVRKIPHADSQLTQRNNAWRQSLWRGGLRVGIPRVNSHITVFGPEGKSVLSALHLEAQGGKHFNRFEQNEKRPTVLFAQLRSRENGQPIDGLLEVPDGYLAAVSGNRRILATVAGTQRFHLEKRRDHSIISYRVEESTVQFWQVGTWKALGPPRKLKGRIWNILLDHDGTRVMLLRDGEEPFEFRERFGWDRPWVWHQENSAALPRTIIQYNTYAFPGTYYTPPVHVQSAVYSARDLLAFSPDGRYVVTRENDPRIARIRVAMTGRPIGSALVHQGPIATAAFSPDGKWLVTGGNDKTARLWNANTSQPPATAMRHEDSVVAVAFSPDGRTILSQTRTGHLRFWDATTAQALGPLVKHGSFAPTGAVAFADDGRQVLSATHRGNLCLWNAPLQPLQGTPSRLAVWAWTLTMAHLDAAGVAGEQMPEQWKTSAKELQKLGGSPVIPESDLEWHRREAEACLSNNAWHAATWQLTRLIQAEPKTSLHVSKRARAYREQGQYKLAVADYSEALGQRPGSVELLHGRGMTFFESEQWGKALADLSRVIDLRNDHVDAWYFQGRCHLNLKQYDQAINDFQRVVELNPKSIWGHYYHGFALSWRGYFHGHAKEHKLSAKAYAQAVEAYNQALSIGRHHVPSLHQRGFCYARLNQHEKAIADYAAIIRIRPDHQGANEKLSSAYENQKHYAAVIAAYKEAVRSNRSFHHGCVALSWFLATCPDKSQRNPAEAIAYAKRAIALKADRRNNWSNLGVALYAAGEWKQALEILTKADAMAGGRDDWHRFFLAMAQWRVGEKVQARKSYHRAVRWMGADRSRAKNKEQIRFRAEANRLLGISKQNSKSKSQKPAARKPLTALKPKNN